MQVSCKRKSYTKWKWSENALRCKQRHCTIYCKL